MLYDCSLLIRLGKADPANSTLPELPTCLIPATPSSIARNTLRTILTIIPIFHSLRAVLPLASRATLAVLYSQMLVSVRSLSPLSDQVLFNDLILPPLPTRPPRSSRLPPLPTQVQLSLLDRRAVASDLTSFCADHCIAVLPYGSVAGGLLSDRYLGAPPPVDYKQQETRSLTKYLLIVEECGGWQSLQSLLRRLRSIADRLGGGTSIAQVDQ